MQALTEIEKKYPPCWIICYPRTGSSYLAGTINWMDKHDPQVYEWLNPSKTQRDHTTVPWKPWQIIPKKMVKYQVHVEPFLRTLPRNLKIHYFDYELFFAPHHLLEITHRLKNLKIIRLRRKDHIATACSYYIAVKTDIFASETEQNVKQHASINVEIDEEELYAYYQLVQLWDKQCEELFHDISHLETSYEDIFTNLSEIYRIHKYLEIDPKDTQVGLRKVKDKKFNHPQTPVIKETLKRLISWR